MEESRILGVRIWGRTNSPIKIKKDKDKKLNDCRYEEEQREVRRRRRRRVVASKLRRQRKKERHISCPDVYNKIRCSKRQKTTTFWNLFKYGCSLFSTSQNTENVEFRLRKSRVNFFICDFL